MKKFSYIVGALCIGIILGLSLQSSAKDRYSNLQLFTKVLNLVQQYYVEKVDTQQLLYGGIKGMLKTLDPHTNFLPPSVYKEFESETSGEFGGLGIEITIKKGVLTIISPIEDTPAWKAGIQPGDRIVTINGESTKGFSLVDAAERMKGKKGSKITLGIIRDGLDEPMNVAIVRDTVKIRSAKYTDLEDGYAYLKITSFIENTGKDVRKSLLKHSKKSDGEIKGLILDLRRNPGGLLSQAVEISNLFLDQGAIVSTIGRNKKDPEIIYAEKQDTLPDFPLVVLIDEYSASASEIVAGALQDNKRALIMGNRSFGKGSVQSVVKLGDGSGLKLTVARYYTPSGRSIQAEGVVPDITIDKYDSEALKKAIIDRDVQREIDIKGHLEGEAEKQAKVESKQSNSMNFWWATLDDEQKKKLNPKEKILSEDFQVLQAYNYLRAWKVMQGFEMRRPSAVQAVKEESEQVKTQ